MQKTATLYYHPAQCILHLLFCEVYIESDHKVVNSKMESVPASFDLAGAARFYEERGFLVRSYRCIEVVHP